MPNHLSLIKRSLFALSFDGDQGKTQCQIQSNSLVMVSCYWIVFIVCGTSLKFFATACCSIFFIMLAATQVNKKNEIEVHCSYFQRSYLRKQGKWPTNLFWLHVCTMNIDTRETTAVCWEFSVVTSKFIFE